MALKTATTAFSTTKETQPFIRLRRLPSSSSSTYPQPENKSNSATNTSVNPFADDADSIYTTTSTIHRSLLPSVNFIPTSSLQIETVGKAMMSFPTPQKELTIPIFASPENDEDIVSPKYTSVREKRSSGSCKLVRGDDELESSIASTAYTFGIGNNPQVKIGADDDLSADCFELVGKSMLSRTAMFESSKWGRFEWRYAGKPEKKALGKDVNNLLVLERIKTLDGARSSRIRGAKEERIVVARLVRSDELRTKGAKPSSAGNGGRLEMCLDRNGLALVDEVTVVVTCLVMLKKEIDRLRGAQIAAIGAGASGGGG